MNKFWAPDTTLAVDWDCKELIQTNSMNKFYNLPCKKQRVDNF